MTTFWFACFAFIVASLFFSLGWFAACVIVTNGFASDAADLEEERIQLDEERKAFDLAKEGMNSIVYVIPSNEKRVEFDLRKPNSLKGVLS